MSGNTNRINNPFSKYVCHTIIAITVKFGDSFHRGNVSESEGEQDGPDNEVTLPQSISSRGNLKSTQSAIR